MKALLRIIAAVLLIAGVSLAGATSAQAASPKWLSISAGGLHTCGIRTDHALYCWGYNGYGQLGNGTTTDQSTPKRVGTSTSWVSVTGGLYHTCALHSSGSIYCWGKNETGQLGLGDAGDPVLKPHKVGTSTSWTSVTAGQDHSCARHKSGAIYCWGKNLYGQLGTGTGTGIQTSPKKVGTSTSWTSVTTGASASFTCARHKSGAIYCWGYNVFGQLGNGTHDNSATPKKVGTSTSWRSVTSGDSHTCARHNSGAVYCWGSNWQGQLGLGDLDDRTKPAKVGTSTSWTSISPAAEHTCALHSGGSVYCWGVGVDGELGDGTTENHRTTPNKINTSRVWSKLTSGGYHSCAISSSGLAYCWGYNYYGQVGNGTQDLVNAPTKITQVS